MLEALRTLRRELDSLLESLKGTAGVFVVSNSIRERIQQFYLSWSNLRPRLESAQVPRAVLNRAESLTEEIVRLSTGRNRKERYRRKLGALRGVLGKELLLEIARLQRSVPAEKVSAHVIERSVLPEIPGLTNDLIPNALYGWANAIRTFLRKNSYDHNAFVMVAYRPALKNLISDVKQALTDLGLNPVVARDHNLTDDLYNPLACLLCCRYGVAIFDEGESKQLHNANIVYELAMMQTLKRPCMILKHQNVKTMPSDFLHKLYEPYSTSKEAADAVKGWWQRLERLQ
ncbi:MAG: hypothetical protein LAO09_18415 [Acidobacteriia bacterium]|nr:hypothetical protein [Terriglobia bacterium]